MDEINEEAAPSSVKKKFKKIKEERDNKENEEIDADDQEGRQHEIQDKSKIFVEDPDIQSAEKLLEQQAL